MFTADLWGLAKTSNLENCGKHFPLWDKAVEKITSQSLERDILWEQTAYSIFYNSDTVWSQSDVSALIWDILKSVKKNPSNLSEHHWSTTNFNLFIAWHFQSHLLFASESFYHVLSLWISWYTKAPESRLFSRESETRWLFYLNQWMERQIEQLLLSKYVLLW